MTNTLDIQINKFGFWSVIVAILTTVISFILPLDIPDGFNASHADRVVWLVENRSPFIAGWVNQIAAMFSLSAVLFCGAWLVAIKNPLRGILAAVVIAMATMAFLIPKFIAIWTIPLLADSISTGAVGAEMADSLLPLLNVSIPFSLYTSFDYLGFWLYSVFALLAAGPLFDKSVSAKLAAITLGLFGVIYQVLLIALLLGAIAPADIGTWFIGVSLLLLVHVVSMVTVFKSTESSPS
jgi:hypothetical protein